MDDGEDSPDTLGLDYFTRHVAPWKPDLDWCDNIKRTTYQRSRLEILITGDFVAWAVGRNTKGH
jgi:hypothetical protein